MVESHSEVFLVRVWAEPRELAGQPSVYRVRIEHAGSFRVLYLRGLPPIIDFIRECLADSDLPPGDFQDDLDA